MIEENESGFAAHRHGIGKKTGEESGTGAILLNWAAPPTFGSGKRKRDRSRKRAEARQVRYWQYRAEADGSAIGNMGKQKSRLT